MLPALLLVFGFVAFVTPASALIVDDKDPLGLTQVETDINLGSQSPVTTTVKLINLAISFLGIIAVIIVLIAGFKWMTAGGNEDKVADARKMLVAGLIGLAIVLSAWAIAKFAVTQLVEVTGGSL